MNKYLMRLLDFFLGMSVGAFVLCLCVDFTLGRGVFFSVPAVSDDARITAGGFVRLWLKVNPGRYHDALTIEHVSISDLSLRPNEQKRPLSGTTILRYRDGDIRTLNWRMLLQDDGKHNWMADGSDFFYVDHGRVKLP